MKLHEAIAVSYMATGQELSDAALKVLCADLAAYPLEGVLSALTRCRKELRKITLADIIERIPGGHPGAEEAWAMVNQAIGNETVTVILTRPMRTAFFAADELAGDEIAARMAFKEVYSREVGIARETSKSPEWDVIMGTDAHDRDTKIKKAITEGKITPHRALPLLAHVDATSLDDLIALAPPGIRKQLEELKVKGIA